MIGLLNLKLLGQIKIFFAQACPPPNNGFFDLPTWYKYLDSKRDDSGNCIPYADFSNGLDPLWGIALALVDILLRIAGMIAIGYIIFAGYVYIRSAGSPEKAQAAQTKLTTAFTGLIIVILATAIVTFIGGKLGG